MDRVLGAFAQPRRPKDQYSISSSYISGSQSCLRERAKPIIADANAASNGDARTGQNAKDQALRRYLGLAIGCRCLSGLLMKERPEHRAWAISGVVVVEDRPMASGRPSTLRRVSHLIRGLGRSTLASACNRYGMLVNLLRPPSTQPSKSFFSWLLGTSNAIMGPGYRGTFCNRAIEFRAS
ncbi:hypothetical protein V8C26DRAFT_433027 [Trichoderma gracile]